MARYLAEHGVLLSAVPESPWVPVASEAAVLLTIANHGTRALSVRGERAVGVWPFDEVEHGCSVLQYQVRWVELTGGVQSGSDTVRSESLATLAIPPGEERSLRIALPWRPSPDCDGASVTIHPTLLPLALEFEQEPERLVALRFPEVRVGFAPTNVATAPAGSAELLDHAIDSRPEEIVMAAARLTESDGALVTDRLILALPGRDRRTRRSLMLALEWVTGRSFGESVERWRGWWEAQGDRSAATRSPAVDAPAPDRER